MRRQLVAVAALLVGAATLAGGETQAAENAAGIYLLGTKGSMAGFTPPPGTYFVDVNYVYAGDASGNAAVGVLCAALETACFPTCPLEPSTFRLTSSSMGMCRSSCRRFCGSRRERSSAAMSASAPSCPWGGRPSMSMSML